MLSWIIFLWVVASIVLGRLEVMAAAHLSGDWTPNQKWEGFGIVCKIDGFVSS
jgi:hypothetical protein